MTIAIAKRIGPTIIAVSDTRISNQLTGETTKPTGGIIKTMIPRPDVCISFAGPTVWVEKALSDIDISKSNHTEIRDHFFKWHLESGNCTDFLIAFSAIEKNILYSIKNGTCNEVDSGWIGSSDAFDEYQSIFHSSGGSVGQVGTAKTNIQLLPCDEDAPNREVVRMLDAFKTLLSTSQLKEIGGFAVPAGLQKNGFGYLIYTQSITHPLRLDDMPPEFTIPFSTAAEGGLTYEVGYASDTNVLPLYFFQGNFGLLFRVEADSPIMKPTLIQHCDPAEFSVAATKMASCEVKSFFANPDTWGRLGTRVAASGDHQQAIEYFTRAIEGIEHVHGDPSSAYIRRGISHAQIENWEQALSDINHAIGINSTDAWFFDCRGTLYFHTGKTALAIQDLEEASRLNPGDLEIAAKLKNIRQLSKP